MEEFVWVTFSPITLFNSRMPVTSNNATILNMKFVYLFILFRALSESDTFIKNIPKIGMQHVRC